MNSVLKRVFNYNHTKLIQYVSNDSLLSEGDKKLIIESLLYMNVLALKDESKLKPKAIETLKAFQAVSYVNQETVNVGNFGKLWTNSGVYYFNFIDKDTALRMHGTRSFLKSFGFTWGRQVQAFVRKEGAVSFDILVLKRDLENAAISFKEVL